MNIYKRTIFIAMATTGLAACAGTEPAAREKDPDVEQIAREIGCTSEEVAICIGVNCEPEDFYCTNRADVRKLFKAGEFSRGSNF